MKVIVVVKNGIGGSGISQATRYVSRRERDEDREGALPRRLFTEREDNLSFHRANRLLGKGDDPRTRTCCIWSSAWRRKRISIQYVRKYVRKAKRASLRRPQTIDSKSRDGGIRTHGLLHPKQALPVFLAFWGWL